MRILERKRDCGGCVYTHTHVQGVGEDGREGLEVFPNVNIRGLIFAKQLFW